MGALLALQVRMMWRGTPAFLRAVCGFLIVVAIMALRGGRPDDELLASMAMGPMALLLFGVVAGISSSETLTWYAPLAPSVRTWARLAILALTGALFTGVLVSIAASGVRLHAPAALLAAHLWLCWIGGGLLILFVGDLVRSLHPALQIILFIVGSLPGIAMVAVHLTSKCPWEVLLAEEAAVALLAALTRVTNIREEIPNNELIWKAGRAPEPKSPEAAAVPAPSSNRRLDRTPSVALLMRAPLGHGPALLLIVLWLLTSVLPMVVSYALMGLFALTMAFQGAFQFWRPFAAAPLARSKTFVLLTTPILALWAVTVMAHGVSSWAFTRSELIRSDPDGLRFDLPFARRTRDAELSTELRRGVLPQDPERLAFLMSEAYRASYGLKITAGQILAVPTPADVVDTAGWLRTVEKHFEPAISRRVVEWRLLAGMALLAMGLLTLLGPLPGRIPRWIRGTLVIGNFVLPLVILLLLSLETNVIANHLLAPMRPLYRAIFDRPGTLTFALAVLSAALYLRHLRVFRTSEVVDPTARS